MNYVVKEDSFKLLPELKDNSVDVIITDPPYDFDSAQQNFLHSHFLRIAKNGVIVFSPPENQWILPAEQYGFWIKPISTKNTRKKYSRFVEMIFFYNIKKWCTGYHWSQYTNVFTDLVESTSKHPYAKPITLVERLIRLHTDVGDTVFDPFAGSGNHLQAAKNLKRSPIGVELNDKY